MIKLVHPIEREESLVERLQVVVIDCAYDTLTDPTTQKFFMKFLAMKLEGFKSGYGHGVLPLGSYDFIGRIVMVCEKNGDELIPVTCFKSSTLDKAKYFSLPFEATTLFHSEAENKHRAYVAQVAKRIEHEMKSISYVSSWTMDPHWGENNQIRHFMSNLTLSTLVNFHQDYKIEEILAGGILRFKIDEIQKFLGFQKINFEGEELPPIDTWFVKNEKALLMHLTSFAPDAVLLGKNYRKLWEDRITLDQESNRRKKIAA